MTGTASDIAAVSADIDLPGDPADHRVVVAMSGGVNSSVVAALLARAGFEVVGITLQLYDHGAATGRKGACCAGQDVRDAARVAERLGIPHYVLDYEARFREAVIEDFAESYRRGETPVPCIRCNERIKFRDLLETARDLGADALATGHYVRRVPGPRRSGTAPRPRSRARPELLSLPHDARRTRFSALSARRSREGRDAGAGARVRPAGRRQSPTARTSASCRRAPMPISSRGCARRPASPATLSTSSGRVLGRHQGIAHFTVGQRKGLDIAAWTAEPLYVLRLDPETRRVVVGPRAALARPASLSPR